MHQTVAAGGAGLPGVVAPAGAEVTDGEEHVLRHPADLGGAGERGLGVVRALQAGAPVRRGRGSRGGEGQPGRGQ